MKKFLHLSSMLILMLTSCTTSSVDECAQAPQEESATHISTPYKLDFMRKVVSEITQTETGDMQATHRYIEFEPATPQEYELLLQNEELACRPFSVLETTDAPENQGKLYALVENGCALPEVAYNVIEEYYTPYAAGSGIHDTALADKIAARAQELETGNRETTRLEKFYPSGRIRVWDDLIEDGVPLEGVHVIITEYVIGSNAYPIMADCYTDSDGQFKTTTDFSFKTVDYKIVWRIEDGWLISTDLNPYPAITKGPSNTAAPWNYLAHYLNSDSISYYCATSHRALHIAKNSNLLNLRGDFLNLYYFVSKPVHWYDNECNIRYPEYFDVDIKSCPSIKIYSQRTSATEILAMIFHALGEFDIYYYNNNKATEKVIKKSWPLFTRWYLLDREYDRVGAIGKLHTYINQIPQPDAYNMQNWTITGDNIPDETPVFIDIYDLYNAPVIDTTRPHIYPVDRIHIPSLPYLKNLAYKSTNLLELKQALAVDIFAMQQYGYTEKYVADYFAYYGIPVLSN